MPKGFKLTQEQFLAKAVAVHGDRYDYSHTVYQSSAKKVKIICPKHGAFEQTPNAHTDAGYGCQKCSPVALLTQDEFIARARAKHGDKYDYSQAVYMGNDMAVKIICPIHGSFEQRAYNHAWRGQGCRACNSSPLLTMDLFVARAREIHGNIYDYSRTSLQHTKARVTITCKYHGPFEQTPDNHLHSTNPTGCPECGKVQRGRAQALTTAQFIRKAQATHGLGAYDYSLVDYVRGDDKVKIICPLHGVFEQGAYSHAARAGCPACGQERVRASSALEWFKQAEGRVSTIYFLHIFNDDEEFYKVGITCRSVKERYRNGGLNSYSYEILAQHSSPDAARIYDWEQSILETFAHLRYWPKLRFGGETECFSSADEILAIFPL
jgi:hypothetical protein